MMTVSAKHMATSQRLIQQAVVELDSGDTLQASEKAWGRGGAFLLESVCGTARAWRHKSHSDLFTVANRLSKETQRPEFNALIRSASALHVNFYEGWLPADSVRDGIGEVESLLDGLEQASTGTS